MRFLLDGGGPKPKNRLLIRHRGGEKRTQEKPRGDRGGDGREVATGPGTDTRSPQKLDEARRTLPWSLCREHRPRTP